MACAPSLPQTGPKGSYVVVGDLSGLLPDCLRLCEWIEEHIANLAARHAADKTVLDERIPTNRTWAPLELGAQIPCLDLYAAGLAADQILAEMPDLKADDLSAALVYASQYVKSGYGQ